MMGGQREPMPEKYEPTISIDGVILTKAQAAIIRIAVNHMGDYINAPGNKAVLEEIADLYSARLREIASIIVMSDPRYRK